MSLSQVLKTLKCWELLCTMVTVTTFVFVHTCHHSSCIATAVYSNLSPPLYSAFVLIGDFNVNVLDTSSSLYHSLPLSCLVSISCRLYKNQLVWPHVELTFWLGTHSYLMEISMIETWQLWESAFMSSIKQCIPEKVLTRRRKLPWVNAGNRHAIQSATTYIVSQSAILVSVPSINSNAI